MLDLLLLIWVQQHLIRQVAPEEYSLLALVRSVTLPLSLLVMAMMPAVGRFVTESYALGREKDISRMTASILPALGIGVVVVLALGAALVWGAPMVLGVSAIRGAEFRFMLALNIAMLAVRLLLIPFSIGIFVVQKHYVYHAIELGASVLKVGVVIALFSLAGTRVLWLVVAQCLTSLLAGVTIAVY